MKPHDVSKDPRFLEQLKRHEGAKRNKQGKHIAYRCTAGALTIGYGHNLDANPIKGINAKSVLREAEAEAILIDDLKVCADDIQSEMAWVRTLDSARVAVLLNMRFNLGLTGLMAFKNFLRHVQQGSWSQARQNMLNSRWASQVGRRAVELATQMESGLWQGGETKVGG